MPRVFNVDKWIVYFWSNESLPLEPIHVHIAYGIPKENSTKIWITQGGGCLLANNGANIPTHILSNLMEIIEARKFEIMAKWKSYFGELKFYC